MEVPKRYEAERGCGWRKPGGLYLVSVGLGMACGKLPIPLTICPTCGEGIKPARSWTWIEGGPLAADRECDQNRGKVCPLCPLGPFGLAKGRVGLIWIGTQHYATVEAFTAEAREMGVSRRITTIPRGFVLGETWVWLAHRAAIVQICEPCQGTGVTVAKADRCLDCEGSGEIRVSAVFRVFRPEAIEYVIRGNESEDVLDGLRARGITPVEVIRQESGALFQ